MSQDQRQGATKGDVAVAKKSTARRTATYFAGFVISCAALEMLSPGWTSIMRSGSFVARAVITGFAAFIVQAIIETVLDSITKRGADKSK